MYRGTSSRPLVWKFIRRHARQPDGPFFLDQIDGRANAAARLCARHVHATIVRGAARGASGISDTMPTGAGRSRRASVGGTVSPQPAMIPRLRLRRDKVCRNADKAGCSCRRGATWDVPGCGLEPCAGYPPGL